MNKVLHVFFWIVAIACTCAFIVYDGKIWGFCSGFFSAIVVLATVGRRVAKKAAARMERKYQRLNDLMK